VRVPTPLSKGTVWVRSGGGWTMLPGVPAGFQRLLRSVYRDGHEVLAGDARALTISKTGTATVALAAPESATGQAFTIRVRVDVEEMRRGESSGTQYRDARIELQVVADLPALMADWYLCPGDEVTVAVPPTIHLRRATSHGKKTLRAELNGQQVVLTALAPGKAKVSLPYWIGAEDTDRFSRKFGVEVLERLEYECRLEPGQPRRVSFAELGAALDAQLPSGEGRVTRVEGWEGDARAAVTIHPGALELRAHGRSRSTAVVSFVGQRRRRAFHARVRVVIDSTGDSAPVADAADPPPQTDPEADRGDADPGELGDDEPGDDEPARDGEPLEVVSRYGAPAGGDYVARIRVENASASDVEVEVTVTFKGRSGQVFGERVAEGPATLAPGKRGRYTARLEGAGAVVNDFEVTARAKDR